MKTPTIVAETIAELGQQGASATANNQLAQINSGSIGPANAVTHISSPFRSINGRVLVMAAGTVNTDASGKRAVYKLVRDPTAPTGVTGTPIGGFVSSATEASDVDIIGFGAVAWVDVVTPGSTHSWGLQITSLVSATIPINQATIVLIDL